MSAGSVASRIAHLEREVARRQMAGCPTCRGRGAGPWSRSIIAGDADPAPRECPQCHATTDNRLILSVRVVAPDAGAVGEATLENDIAQS
jgi:hypothetical protein